MDSNHNTFLAFKDFVGIDDDVLHHASCDKKGKPRRKATPKAKEKAARMIMHIAFENHISVKDADNRMAWFAPAFLKYGNVKKWKQTHEYGDAAPYGVKFASHYQ